MKLKDIKGLLPVRYEGITDYDNGCHDTIKELANKEIIVDVEKVDQVLANKGDIVDWGYKDTKNHSHYKKERKGLAQTIAKVDTFKVKETQ